MPCAPFTWSDSPERGRGDVQIRAAEDIDDRDRLDFLEVFRKRYKYGFHFSWVPWLICPGRSSSRVMMS
jgi:hypothetical protein